MDNEKKKILIVEDEKNIAQMLAFNLSQAGYDFDIAYEGEEGLKKALDEDFDLILLDIMLPKLDGFEVCRRIRVKKSTPIIIVTAREEEIDKILGLDLGADDYVTKPFSIKVLLARVKSNIRRASNELVNGTSGDNPEVIRIRDLMIDCERYQVTNRGEQIMLTKKNMSCCFILPATRGRSFLANSCLRRSGDMKAFTATRARSTLPYRGSAQSLRSTPPVPNTFSPSAAWATT